MKPAYWRHMVLLGIILPLGIGGCRMSIGSWGQEKFTRTWTDRLPRESLTNLSVHTRSGRIAITGSDANDFDLTAEIVARAATEEEAAELAEQVEIVCRPDGDTLEIDAHYENPGPNRSISVSYMLVVPRRMNVKGTSSYGSLTFSDLDGSLAGKTSSGSVDARRIKGPVDLESSYGSVSCADANGPGIVLRTSSGGILAMNISGSLRAVSSYGSVTCQGFSNGDLSLKTSSGGVAISDAAFATCEAESSYGAVRAEHAAGKAMKLHSGSGSISADGCKADQMNLSTSYGSVNVRNAATANLSARSSSGAINCELSPDSPPSLTADVTSSYGSVAVATPPGFAGQVDLSTSYGSIHTTLPITISGEVSKRQLIGTIGQGPGRLRLHTGSGSVSLR
jgi:DUF4097 and DUF4098 domain-containing protein YvlB